MINPTTQIPQKEDISTFLLKYTDTKKRIVPYHTITKRRVVSDIESSSQEYILFSPLQPTLDFGSRFPFDWESHLRTAAAFHVAQHHHLNFTSGPGINIGSLTLAEVQGYYNPQQHLGKYSNTPTFLSELLNNQQRSEIIDNLYDTAVQYLDFIQTDKFNELKTYINSRNIPAFNIRAGSLEQFAQEITSEFFISHPYKQKTSYLTEQQKSMITPQRIIIDDDCI